MLRTAIVIDYQNMSITGAKLFLPEKRSIETQINPLNLAEQIIAARNAVNDAQHQVQLLNVFVFRGQPSKHKNPTGYAITKEQKERWEQSGNGLVKVTLRPLKYTRIALPDGTIKEIAQEKGVDVLCALTLVRLAQSGEYDVVILASRDTDLAPALDEANRTSQTKIEAVKWYDPDNRTTYGSIKTETRIWTTSLTRQHHQASLDHPQ